MNVIDFILLLLAAICFFFAWLSARPDPPAYPAGVGNLLALGLLFWVLVPLISAGQSLGG
jgi:hypothetical protein